jgi:transcriptional regulator with XRE-family HTH domain
MGKILNQKVRFKPNETTLGDRIRQARRQFSSYRGTLCSQQEVADALHVSGVAVSRWESGEKEPSLKRVEALARFLAVSPGWLAFGSTFTEAATSNRQILANDRYSARLKATIEQEITNRPDPIANLIASDFLSSLDLGLGVLKQKGHKDEFIQAHRHFFSVVVPACLQNSQLPKKVQG